MSIKLDHLYLFYHKSGVNVPFHSHDCYELCYYIEGCGNTTFDHIDAPYKAFDYVIYKPHIVHNETHDNNSTVLCLTFRLEDEDYTIQSGIYSDADKIILDKCTRMRYEYETRHSNYRTMIELLIAEMLICHNRHQGQEASSIDEISRIRALLDINFANDIKIEEIIKLTGYSYHHFRHIFKDKIGLSPKNYVMHKRIEYAKNMLLNSDNNISEIALISGFSSSSQFSSIFKKHINLSPTEYRLKQKAK